MTQELRVEAARIAQGLIALERYQDVSFGDLTEEVYKSLAVQDAPRVQFTVNSAGTAYSSTVNAKDTWAKATAESPTSPEAPASATSKHGDVYSTLRAEAEKKLKDPLHKALALGAIDRLQRFLK